MANERHLEILKQGVDAWNQWREKNPDIDLPVVTEKKQRKQISLIGMTFRSARRTYGRSFDVHV